MLEREEKKTRGYTQRFFGVENKDWKKRRDERSERGSSETADGFLFFCTLVSVNVAPRGAADQLCESAGLLGDTIGEMHRTDNSRGRALRSG